MKLTKAGLTEIQQVNPSTASDEQIADAIKKLRRDEEANALVNRINDATFTVAAGTMIGMAAAFAGALLFAPAVLPTVVALAVLINPPLIATTVVAVASSFFDRDRWTKAKALKALIREEAYRDGVAERVAHATVDGAESGFVGSLRRQLRVAGSFNTAAERSAADPATAPAPTPATPSGRKATTLTR